MYKVIIVDDEEIIVQGLKDTLPWGDFNCEVIAVAHDAQSAIELIAAHHPDIMFTDICMPGMDGLEMISSIKENYPNMQMSVLTGFRNFEYAQKAINLGICRFLLKPTELSELNEALATMVANLDYQNDPRPKTGILSPNEKQKAESGSSFIVSNALKYIDRHYNEKLTLIEVAEKTYVSQWHLSKLLKKHTNQSFCDILNQARIRRAKDLLDDPSLKIHEISEKVGFSDVTHFSKIFKKIEGVSPNEFRNSVIGKLY
ncbi:MAG: response regulator [Oscillospiraceae bacterium]|jgi:two-component system response regulator YesN|nr:response regulator [Oscillospiraceae bacterium]